MRILGKGSGGVPMDFLFFPTRDPVLSPLEIYGCCFGTVARFVVVPTATVAHPIRFQVMGGFAWYNNNNNTQ